MDIIIYFLFGLSFFLMANLIRIYHRINWVCDQRLGLLKWYFSENKGNPISYKAFNDRFGTLKSWVDKSWCYDPAKLAGLDVWPLKRI